jgi:bifunctional non-homologous end joining protein LigD
MPLRQLRTVREMRARLAAAKKEATEFCQATRAERPPSGPGWLHEIKHDGYRMMVRRDGGRVRIITRNGHDWSSRYPLITSAANALPGRSFVIDGEAVACDESGLAVFQRLRERRYDGGVFFYAFDLIEWNGRDLKREPIERRKAALAKLLKVSHPGIRLVEHLDFDDGEMIFEHACSFGCEGIVSKRLGSRYPAGPSRDWINIKNPNAPAVKREAEEDWSK